MVVYYAINNKEVNSKRIKHNNHTVRNVVYNNIDKLRKDIFKKYKTLKGWYFITLDIKKDRLNLDYDSTGNNKQLFLEIPFIINLENKLPLPLYNDNKIWKRIPNFSKYLASDKGEILTLKTGNFTKGISAGHYLKVSLFKDGKRKSKMEYVHILICKTFHGDNKNNLVVMHGDDNKFNNMKDNLSWGTQSENIQDVWDKRKGKITMEHINLLKEMNNTLQENNKLRVHTNMLSLEDGFTSKIADYVMSGISNTVKTFNKGFDKLSDIVSFDNGIDISDIKKNSLKVARDIKDIEFKNISERNCPVVLGMKVNLIEFTDTLTKITEISDDKIKDHLTALSLMLSNIISDEKYRKSFKPKNFINEVNKLNVDINEELYKLIDPKNNDDRMKLSSLIPNLASVSHVTKDVALLAVKLKSNNLNDVMVLVEKISEQTDILRDYISTSDNNFVMSKRTIDDLAYGLDLHADLVTYYSTTYSLINQTVGMTNNMIEIIKK